MDGALAQVAMLGPEDMYLDAPLGYGDPMPIASQFYVPRHSYMTSHWPVSVAVPMTVAPAQFSMANHTAYSSVPASTFGGTTSRELAPHPMTTAEHDRYKAALAAGASQSVALAVARTANASTPRTNAAIAKLQQEVNTSSNRRTAGLVLFGAGLAAVALVGYMALKQKK